MKLLDVKNLKTYFETKNGLVKAVDDVSFSLDYGKSVGIAGESGCGKTTTALSIMKLLPDNAKIFGGEILFEQEDLLKLDDVSLRKKRWKDVSIIFQGAMNALNPVMRIGEQIAEVVVLHEGLTFNQGLKRAEELFSLVEIKSDRINSYPHEFSGGMKQRAMIAMALACNPKIIIGDEPTTALDVMVQAQILDLIDKLRNEFNMGFILITHDLSILGETCDDLIIMYAGKIVEKGSIEDVFNNAGHPYTIKLLKSFPDIHGEKVISPAIPGFPPNLLNAPTGCKFHPRCEHAVERCRIEEPELRRISDNHFVSCHLGGI
jgi:peptide/nickel transport system ATP-binding protein